MQNSSDASTNPSMKRAPAAIRLLAHAPLQPAAEGLSPVFDAHEGADNAADEDRAQDDEKGGRRTDVGNPRRLAQRQDVDRGHDQRDKAEGLRDEVTRALRKAPTHHNADAGTHHDRRHVEQRPQPDHRVRLAAPAGGLISSRACPDRPGATRR